MGIVLHLNIMLYVDIQNNHNFNKMKSDWRAEGMEEAIQKKRWIMMNKDVLDEFQCIDVTQNYLLTNSNIGVT